jgi:outer membrane protein OmpA-like peptidoglycan-associated protein
VAAGAAPGGRHVEPGRRRPDLRQRSRRCPPPLHFTLHFRFESDRLTDEALALLPKILQNVKERAVPDVLVIGHTDTAGSADANLALGLMRAMAIRDLLVQAGLHPSAIDVLSTGERDLLVRTADGMPEPRNRRVEIAVR